MDSIRCLPFAGLLVFEFADRIDMLPTFFVGEGYSESFYLDKITEFSFDKSSLFKWGFFCTFLLF